MGILDTLNPKAAIAFKKMYYSFHVSQTDRTDADLDLLESLGLLHSRILKEDDDFFGLDSLEPGERCYDLTRSGQALCDQVEKEYAADFKSWAYIEDDLP